MSEPTTAAQSRPATQGEPIVNRLSITVATVNGSGSQTANNTLLRSIFQMGVPVSGKNLFPSNIAGLPTWFTIRANADGYVARRKEIDVLVCMNPQTAKEDVAGVPPGATVIYEEGLRLERQRDDVDLQPLPAEVRQSREARDIPLEAVTIYATAQAMEDDGETDRAVELYRQLVDRFPDMVEAREALQTVVRR